VRPAGSIFGSGVTLGAGSALINNASGTVQGANSQGIGAGAGVYLRFGDLTLTNHGTIRGASDLAGVVAGNAAISEDGSTWNIAIINRGVIRAGAGQSNAIVFGQTAASASLLEVQAGSTIEGNVIGAELGTSDVLRLGGAANASFDVSAIGAEAQYRNFDIFEKTGAGTWHGQHRHTLDHPARHAAAGRWRHERQHTRRRDQQQHSGLQPQ
jgi:hypothetical protein